MTLVFHLKQDVDSTRCISGVHMKRCSSRHRGQREMEGGISALNHEESALLKRSVAPRGDRLIDRGWVR